MRAVVGLGNPGPKYANTRHNVGHMVIDELVRRAGGKLTAHRSRTFLMTGRMTAAPIDEGGFVLAVCDSYMNVSGGPVNALLKYFKIEPSELLVIHDDLDLPAHTLRLKDGGGEGGHNGLKSITNAIGTKNYQRLRIGLGRPPGSQDAADFVLSPLKGAAQTEYQVTVAKAADAVDDVLTMGFVAAQARLHAG
ncbi:aminoacyl-tRNA hydrolase [Flaviflexus salsibiostraticola]|uniref:Peptidyl-tRNA hydrolase n=1 Tax=Flaviflexus salsibiostraticola TaxID=1282737 RepID=A0A3Q8WUJ8_9ACTO|nr:aminoacyl-tRNA hydrolase [Flaviflexus salsibiostraticola]AZN30681.1 aminoacyl-tRNA hydrolase [Flaviflexus salsibiostraticola]